MYSYIVEGGFSYINPCQTAVCVFTSYIYHSYFLVLLMIETGRMNSVCIIVSHDILRVLLTQCA